MEENNNHNGGQLLCIFTLANALVSISDVNQIIQIAAGLMAICCGGFTSFYYYKKTKNLNNEKEERS